MDDRAWMYEGLNDEYFKGVDEFIKFALEHPLYVDEGKIKCPCWRCNNCKWYRADEVKSHLYHRGFMSDYHRWTAHGETIAPSNPQLSMYDQLTGEQRMVFDIAGPNFVVYIIYLF